MPIVLARLDQRLIHGQVLASPALARDGINGVILADDNISPELRRIYDSGMEAADVGFAKGRHYVKPSLLPALLREKDTPDSRFLVLFRDPKSVLVAVTAGLGLESLNLGNYATLSPDPVVLCSCLKLGPSELEDLNLLSRLVPLLYFGSLEYSSETSRAYKPPGTANTEKTEKPKKSKRYAGAENNG
ncbi:MAG: PTS sugar transporter subunit IIB [Deltaproteobacteria bacterium]|jgi:mannose/fructose/N-acetylgalactosamine-specific phosphotransferase system component IIB|nr:PTS sugar transporter subunit IIB [Deltaproteobacteria bacterium]